MISMVEPNASPNQSFQADRDPRERGSRPLNSNRSRDACASRERPGAAFVQRRVHAAQARREQAAGPDAGMALRTQACCEPSRRRSAPGR